MQSHPEAVLSAKKFDDVCTGEVELAQEIQAKSILLVCIFLSRTYV